MLRVVKNASINIILYCLVDLQLLGSHFIYTCTLRMNKYSIASDLRWLLSTRLEQFFDMQISIDYRIVFIGRSLRFMLLLFTVESRSNVPCCYTIIPS